MSDAKPSEKIQPEPATEVFVVHGVDPEVLAYAMAKYSRSALSMKESLREINEQKAEKFLNTFYFQYGHRSIADLAHIAMAIEKLSILAAVAVVDEQRWDGQERSTRYQDFKKGGYYVPDCSGSGLLDGVYRQTIDALFHDYEWASERVFEYLRDRTPRPAEMKTDAYERTLRARAFDISRYLLPLAANTSLGQIVNARTLETQIARLLSSSHAEVRHLGELLKRAAREKVFNPNEWKYREIVEEAKGRDEGWGRELFEVLLRPIAAAPTLVKHAEASAYISDTRRELRQAAAELMAGAAIEPAPVIDLLDDEPVEVELASTLLYEHSHYSYRQLRERVAALSSTHRDEIIALGTRHRGGHDELLRPFCAGQGFRFDILMDIGAFRDLHRHRRCIQIVQDFTTAHGYDEPEEMEPAGVADRYRTAMQRTASAVERVVRELHSAGDPEAVEKSQYAIPLAYRKRALFKMDFAEVVYISELRTGTGGHISYRRVAYQMYEAVARRHPSLAKHIRVTDVREPVDLLKR